MWVSKIFPKELSYPPGLDSQDFSQKQNLRSWAQAGFFGGPVPTLERNHYEIVT